MERTVLFPPSGSVIGAPAFQQENTSGGAGSSPAAGLNPDFVTRLMNRGVNPNAGMLQYASANAPAEILAADPRILSGAPHTLPGGGAFRPAAGW
eukprot:tig00000681_g3072.t1